MNNYQNDLIYLTPFLKKYALVLTGNNEDAEDLVQKTMFNAVLKEDKFEYGTNLKKWLGTVMVNIFRDNKRKENKKKPFTEYTFNNVKQSTSNLVFQNLSIELINTLINELPKKDKDVFLLYIDGYKAIEIADLYNVSLNVVLGRIKKTKKNLKIKLKELGYENSKA